MIHCVVCSTEKHPREAEHGLLCHGDSNRILRHLRELEEYLPTLSLLRSPGGMEPIGKASFGPRSPANDAAIVHTDPRSGTEVITDARGEVKAEYGALGVVSSWASVVVEGRNVKPSPSAFLDIGLLRRNHDWVVRQAWVDEYARELKFVHAAVRKEAHDEVPKPVGKCIRFENNRECKGDVYELDDASGVICSRDKRHKYTGLDLDRLRVAQDGETA